MRMDKKVWVEQGVDCRAIRIFRTRKAAANAYFATQMEYRQAISDIRTFCWLRSNGECELCGDIVTAASGHLHEQRHRGKGGETSIWNSIFVCAKTHKREHRDREPRWSKHDSR